jgi:hypothetical protein
MTLKRSAHFKLFGRTLKPLHARQKYWHAPKNLYVWLFKASRRDERHFRMFRKELANKCKVLDLLTRHYLPSEFSFDDLDENWLTLQLSFLILALFPVSDFNSVFPRRVVNRLTNKPISWGDYKDLTSIHRHLNQISNPLILHGLTTCCLNICSKLYWNICSWMGLPGGYLYSSLLLVYFGLRGYPGEGPRTHTSDSQTEPQTEPQAKRQKNNNFYALEEAKLEEYLEQLETEQVTEAKEIELDADMDDSDYDDMDEEEDEEEEDEEGAFDYGMSYPEEEEISFQGRALDAKKKKEIGGKQRLLDRHCVGTALALSDLSKAQQKDIARLINGISAIGPRTHQNKALTLQLQDLEEYRPLIAKELELIGSKIQDVSKVWTEHKTVNGKRRHNDNVVMISSIPLDVFHPVEKKTCNAKKCHRILTKHNTAKSFLECTHSEIFCDFCIDTCECPICHDSTLKTKLEQFLCANLKDMDVSKVTDETPRPWEDISIFTQKSGRFGALIYFKKQSNTIAACQTLKEKVKPKSSKIRIWDYQNIKATKTFLKHIDLQESVQRAISKTNWGKYSLRKNLKLVLWSDGCGPYTVSAIVLLDPATGIFSEVESFMWMQGGEHLLKFVFGNITDGIDHLNEIFEKENCKNGPKKASTFFTIDGIIDMGDHHLSNVIAGIGAGQSSYRDIRGHSLSNYSHLVPYHHWESVWSVKDREIIFNHQQKTGSNQFKEYEGKYDLEPHKKIEDYYFGRNARTATFKVKVPSLYSYCEPAEGTETMPIISLCPRFHNDFHRNSAALGMYLRCIAPLLKIHRETWLKAPGRLNEKGDMVASFQATREILEFFENELTPMMSESGVATIEAFAHGLTLALSLTKMEARLQWKGKPIKNMKAFARRYAVYSYTLHMICTQLSATFGHQVAGRKTAKNYQNNIYSLDNLTHMFRELIQFPSQVKVTERMFEAMLKEIRMYINTSHLYLDGLTDFFNRRELRTKWCGTRSVRSGKPKTNYRFKLPSIIVKGSVMKWRYPTKNSRFGLPVCPTLTRGFFTELLNFQVGDSKQIVMNTKKMETRYNIGQEGGSTITIDPQMKSLKQLHKDIDHPEKIPQLLFKNPSTTFDTELRQLFDAFDEAGAKKLPTRCLAPLLCAARVKKFLNPLQSAKLVDQMLNMLEVNETEGTFDYEFFKTMVLFHTDPADLPTNKKCLQKVDTEAVMEMMGLPLSSEEITRYCRSATIKHKLSLPKAFDVYEYIRGQRLRSMLSDSKDKLRTFAQKNIKQLLREFKTSQETKSFFQIRVQNNIVTACNTWKDLAQLGTHEESKTLISTIPAFQSLPSPVKCVSSCKAGTWVLLKSDKYHQINWRLAKVTKSKRLNTTKTIVEYLNPLGSDGNGNYPGGEPNNFWEDPWYAIEPHQTEEVERTQLCIKIKLLADMTLSFIDINRARRHLSNS